MNAFDRLIEALRDHNRKVRQTGNRAMAQCPAHDDGNPSLSITQIEGRVLVHCHAGCHIDDVLTAIGWVKADMYDDRKGCTYPYDDGAQVRRCYDKDGKKQFPQTGHTNGAATVLWRRGRVEKAVANGETIVLVEGEDDVLAVESLGIVATSARMGAGNFHKADVTPLYGAEVIAIVDNDEKGETVWAPQVLAALDGKAKSLDFAKSKVGKDISDHIAAGYTLAEIVPWYPPEPTKADEENRSRWVNLDQFLDGTYNPEQPSIGATREDGAQFLYRGRWHTVIGLTTAGKTTFALWQVKSVLECGGHVVYIHFEEASPGGIIHRLRGLGVDIEVMRKQLHWGHVDTPWKWGELEAEIEQLEQPPQLAVFDGINAACGQQGWAVKEPESVGAYRVMFVHPLTKIGAAVLSLGHPPKAVNRQGESYSYGAAGWLNDVDGVGYRMTASKTPIGKGVKGSSALHVVKDRYGEVQRHGELQSGDGMPWWYMGQVVVDDTLPEDTSGLLPKTTCHITVPARNEEGTGRDKIDGLCDDIITHLRETTGRFETVNKLKDALRAAKVRVRDSDVTPALLRLAGRELIEWPEVPDRHSRPGWLINIEEG